MPCQIHTTLYRYHNKVHMFFIIKVALKSEGDVVEGEMVELRVFGCC